MKTYCDIYLDDTDTGTITSANARGYFGDDAYPTEYNRRNFTVKYLGHKNVKDNSEQTLKEHLIGVSELAGKFASEFGEDEVGKLVGLYHDIGKYSKNLIYPSRK